MFQLTVKSAKAVPGVDYVHIVGTDYIGSARIGSIISDGTTNYEIISIPFMHKDKPISVDEVDICIRAGEYTVSDMVGKILQTI